MRRGWDWDAFAFGLGLGPRGWGFGTGREGRRRWRGGGRWFEAGDMKYVILKLLKDRPMHGYEIMKELEQRMHGCYSPSPGTVYPTLQWLEDGGLVKAQEVDGKKVYEITDQGREFLVRHRDTVDEIFDRLKDTIERLVGMPMPEINRALGRLVTQVYRSAWRLGNDDEAKRKVVQILERAAKELEGLA